MTFDLSGKVALVSGAASGMGRAASLALAEQGADLMLADLNEAGAAATARENENSTDERSRSLAVCLSRDLIRGMFAQLDRQFGRIDFLANIAGEGVRGKPEAIALDDVERTWRNLVYGRFCWGGDC